jgi:hypothetical protein
MRSPGSLGAARLSRFSRPSHSIHVLQEWCESQVSSHRDHRHSEPGSDGDEGVEEDPDLENIELGEYRTVFRGACIYSMYRKGSRIERLRFISLSTYCYA